MDKENFGLQITDEDIEWVKSIMPDIELDECRIQILKNMNSVDIHACPGSGKTTILVAKLAILSRKWKWQNRGICVLSHTNVAREEIEERLGTLSVGKKLLSYPHFIGTFQTFLDTFIAMPFLRSCGCSVNIIDTDYVLERRWKSIRVKKWLEAYGKDKYVCDPLELFGKSTHNRRERPVYGHCGWSRGRFYYRITTFEGRPWDARDPHKTTFMALKHAIRLSIWRKQKETPGVEKAPGVSLPQRKESGRSGRDDGELRFGVRPGHPRKAVTSISQAEALAHGLTHLHHLVFAAVLARELDWCAALQDAREDARPWGVVGIGLRSDVWVEVRRDDHRPAVLVT